MRLFRLNTNPIAPKANNIKAKSKRKQKLTYLSLSYIKINELCETFY